MPIYEYSCRQCHTQFELLVRTGSEPACTTCGSKDLERLLSIPAIKSDTTHSAALASAKKRNEKVGREKSAAQREYELKHND